MKHPMLFALHLAFVIVFSTQVAGQRNKIPDQAREILENATQFELLSIGHRPSIKNRSEDPREDFHGWYVLGKSEKDDIVKTPPRLNLQQL